MQPRSIAANIPGLGYARIQMGGGEIASVARIGEYQPDTLYCSRGFTDLQINGFAGVDFSAPGLEPEALGAVLPEIWRTGVTAFCPTLLTGPLDRLERNLRVLEAARCADARVARAVPCYHLEGPWLSPGPSHGAHDPQWMRQPAWEEFQRLQNAANGNIGILTLAPELPGALDFASRAVASGVRVAIGHTDGTSAEVHRAAEAGATLATHLGNGCPQTIHRHIAPFWGELDDVRLYASIICDNFHLPAELIRIIYRVKGARRTVLVTDAIHAAGKPPGRYTLAGLPIELLSTGQVVTADRRFMAGSALRMDAAVSNFMHATGAPLEDALRLAVDNPQGYLGRELPGHAIAAGEPADFVLFRFDGAIHIAEVLVAGEPVFYSEN